MATLDGSRLPEGVSAVGSERPQVQGGFYVQSGGKNDSPSFLAMDSVTDAGVRVTWYLWIDSTGDVRVHTAIPSNETSDGTIVGTQS